VRDGHDLGAVHVRGVHQLPARVQQALLGQPFDRAQPGGRQAVAHLGHLLGHMDVDRPAEALGQHAQPVDRFGPRRTQRMDRDAGIQPRVGVALHGLRGGPDVVGIEVEACLVRPQRGLREARALVQHRQQRQPDAHLGRGFDQRMDHRVPVGVGLAIRLVLHVVELADLGVAAAQQLA
jgi:hypothetical protein